ncbi:VOC family protein [Aliihoeflea sp. PC F10.4]
MNAWTRRSILKAGGIVTAAAFLPSVALSSTPGTAAAAPVNIGKVGLLARDAARLAEWYIRTVGLEEIAAAGSSITLGVNGKVLLELLPAPEATHASPQSAGLYHTAFLLPSRVDLAAWVLHAASNDFSIDGASDHLVSEAVYLTDPEGNGVEIYADRDQLDWHWSDGQVEMASLPLDFERLVQSRYDPSRSWQGAKTGTIVGHVHLRVGDAQSGGRWWQEEMGFDAVRSRAGAVFLSTGRYHHHIAVNEWQSAGARQRSPGEAGLAYIELLSREHADGTVFADPWGTEIRIAAKA